MNTKDSVPLTQLREMREAWTGYAPLESSELVALFVVTCYLVNVFDEVGWVWTGFSYCERDYLSLLVVRATIEGTAHVCFVSERDFVSCCRVFCSMLDEGRVVWRPDKFR